MENTKVQWHLGFASAIDLELAKNRSDLTCYREYNLNKQALEVDLLVIKKESNIPIDNEIGNLFRKYNIVEYKSPKDHLSMCQALLEIMEPEIKKIKDKERQKRKSNRF